MKFQGCMDNSCQFAPYPRTGMRTNGGCHCLENLGFKRSAVDSLPLMIEELLKLREENERLKQELYEIQLGEDL